MKATAGTLLQNIQKGRQEKVGGGQVLLAPMHSWNQAAGSSEHWSSLVLGKAQRAAEACRWSRAIPGNKTILQRLSSSLY